jgi:protein SCO1/2
VPHSLARRGGLLAVIGSLSLLAACGTSVKPPPDSLGSVVDFAVPSSIAHIPLTKPNGTTTDLASYQGKTVMIADFLTECTDICPLISANTATMARSLNTAGARTRTTLLEITLDPRRDTLSRLRAYQRLYGTEPDNWILLRASPSDTHTLWRYFGVYDHRVNESHPPDTDWLTGKPLTYDIDHSDDLIFLGPDGHERFLVDGNPDTQGRPPPQRLTRFLGRQGHRALAHPNPAEDWTVEQGLTVFSWLLNQPLATSS